MPTGSGDSRQENEPTTVPDPCRVLILNERDPRHPAAGGAELHVFEIFSRLAARGYPITLLCERFAGAAERLGELME